MVLIGIMGQKGSGKTTCANHLKDNYGFIEKSFADPLKRACQELFSLTDHQIYGTQQEKETPDKRWFNCTPRKMLQFVGTDLLRNNLEKIMPGIGVDIFVHAFKIWYEQEISKNPNINIVLSDVRFQNEVNLVQELGGIVVKINRNGLDTTDMHPSEIEMQNISTYNFTIDNNQTLERLYKKINCIITQKSNN